VPEYNHIDSGDEYSEEWLDEYTAEEYKSKNGTVWSSERPGNTHKILAHNILRSKNTGPTKKTKGLSIVHTFKLLLTEAMCDLIIRETNRKAILCFQNSNESDRVHSKDWKPLTSSEFDAYIGVVENIFPSNVSRFNEHSAILVDQSVYPF
uniref:DDE_Tnp_1_7 domain-containing protein n=1 Tax=Anopheles quadriannulatus TaxID=34691 RepID=A0A182WUF3_ANOQN